MRETKTKLQNFRTMIESFKVMSQTANAFDLAEHVCKVSGLIQEFKKDGTPEGISRMENIEELLNGIKDFVGRSTRVSRFYRNPLLSF